MLFLKIHLEHSYITLTCLQVTVWGDYSRIEGKKVFMGVAQIMLDDLDLSNIVIGWYKLFGTSSLVSVPHIGHRLRPSRKNFDKLISKNYF